MIQAGAGLILVHDDIEAPMQDGFDGPMEAENMGEAFGRHCCAEQVTGGFGGCFAGLRVIVPMATRPG